MQVPGRATSLCSTPREMRSNHEMRFEQNSARRSIDSFFNALWHLERPSNPVGLASPSTLRADQTQRPSRRSNPTTAAPNEPNDPRAERTQRPPRRTNPTQGARPKPGAFDRTNPIPPPNHPTSPDRTKPRFRFVQERSASFWSLVVAPNEPNAGRPQRRTNPTPPCPAPALTKRTHLQTGQVARLR
jgi:hypothetical protein